jgi:hypothetical protein
MNSNLNNLNWLQEQYISQVKTQKVEQTNFEPIQFSPQEEVSTLDEYTALLLEKSISELAKIPITRIDAAMLNKVRNDFIKLQENSQLLNVEDLLPIVYPELEITLQESKEICKFIGLDTLGKNNPTTEQVIKYLLECIRNKNKVDLIMSCCIGQTSEFRNNKVRYFVGKETKPIETFFTKTQVNSLDKIYEIIENSKLDFKLNIRLGDMDFWAVDKISDWCDESNLEKARNELLVIKENLVDSIRLKFPQLDFEISNWSEFYTSNEFEQTFEQAKQTKDLWLDPKFEKQCLYTYFKSWGYEKVQKELNLSDQEILDFIITDIQKIAGQYRVEANKSKGIVVWSQGYGKPSWPLIISDFDKQGLPPTISLTPNN